MVLKISSDSAERPTAWNRISRTKEKIMPGKENIRIREIGEFDKMGMVSIWKRKAQLCLAGMPSKQRMPFYIKKIQIGG